MKAKAVVEKVIFLIEKHGDENYGEKVTQLEHMMQTAELAKEQGYDEEIIIAAFLHDIGHLCARDTNFEQMDDCGVLNHEVIGSKFLQAHGFSEKIASLVEKHVQAKRYLAFKNKSYYENLSAASKTTLLFQGGIMNTQEAVRFEKNELFDLAIELRIWDDLAKEIDYKIPDLDYIRKIMLAHLKNN